MKCIIIRCKIVSCNTIITILFYCEFLATQLQIFFFFLNSIFNRICFAVWEYKHTSLSGYYTPLVVTTVKPECIKLLFMYLQRARERMTILSHESNVHPVCITVLPLVTCHDPLFTDRPCVIWEARTSNGCASRFTLKISSIFTYRQQISKPGVSLV